MKPDYKNWVPKSMVAGLAAGTALVFVLFLLLGAAGLILHGTPRLICGIVFGLGTLVLLFFTVWMAVLYRTFDYNGKRKLAKTIIDCGTRVSAGRRHRTGRRLRQRCADHRLREAEPAGSHGRLRHLVRRV